MRRLFNVYSLWGIGTALVIISLLLAARAEAAAPSSLSKWLSKEAVPELRQQLRQHPRYQGQSIAIVSAGNDALSQALVKLLHLNLENRAGISVWRARAASNANRDGLQSIDALVCEVQAQFEYTVQVTARSRGGNRGEVSIALTPVAAPDVVNEKWQWQGKLNVGEREYLERPTDTQAGNGSLGAPWNSSEIDLAAHSLSRELACALRPQVVTHLGLQWPDQTAVPGIFADTVNASRHLLGSYRELAYSEDDADYALSIELQRFGDNTWQLWLISTPRRAPLLPVQAVTYIRVSDPTQLMTLASGTPTGSSYGVPAGDPLDYIDVEMLDATQRDKGRTAADLEVTLRIANRAEWPLEYSFSLSGGHFNHCIANPAYYRHDGYGKLQGSLPAGDSVVRRLLIKGASHQPTPMFGTRKCAGFRDLDGFEDFASQGYKVTDFVRWDLNQEVTR